MPAKYPAKASWATIGGVKKYYRSKMELNFAYYLEWLKSRGLIKDWQHESETFWFLSIKRGVRSYLPDFKVTNNDDSIVYKEVKGYMDSRSLVKIKRFNKFYPQFTLEVIRTKHMNAIDRQVGAMIPGWESAIVIKKCIRKAKARAKRVTKR